MYAFQGALGGCKFELLPKVCGKQFCLPVLLQAAFNYFYQHGIANALGQGILGLNFWQTFLKAMLLHHNIAIFPGVLARHRDSSTRLQPRSQIILIKPSAFDMSTAVRDSSCKHTDPPASYPRRAYNSPVDQHKLAATFS